MGKRTRHNVRSILLGKLPAMDSMSIMTRAKNEYTH
jgi:hypothetical protein